jgi:hypothetical protein
MPEQRIREWLLTEGYPLEFRTALTFRKCGFSIRQGEFVKSSKESLREVDVVAYATAAEHLRVYQVVECKWSGDKPWVVFTSEHQRIAESACVNQTIGSLLGTAIAWILAGDPEIAKLELFASPVRPGFGGRQAFVRASDLFYNTIQSAVSKAKAIVDKYDEHVDLEKRIPRWGAIAFPVVVLQAGLFEAYMDRTTGDMAVEQARHLRIHWRGSEAWSHHATVDVVVEEYLQEFAQLRAHETDALIDGMRRARENIENCWQKCSLADLDFRPAGRGTTGLPRLLREVLRKEQKSEKDRRQIETEDNSKEPRA